MRLAALLALRILSAFCGLLALLATGKLVLGAYAVLTVQQEFPDASAGAIGYVHGRLIDAPLFLAMFFGMMAFVSWRGSRRFRKP